jgi:hypothetical protein
MSRLNGPQVRDSWPTGGKHHRKDFEEVLRIFDEHGLRGYVNNIRGKYPIYPAMDEQSD